MAILKLHTEMNYSGMSLMNWEVQYPPDGFIAADVSSHFILPNLIMHSPSIVRPNTAMSDPLLIYLHTYLMDVTEWQHSTLMCALNSPVRS